MFFKVSLFLSKWFTTAPPVAAPNIPTIKEVVFFKVSLSTGAPPPLTMRFSSSSNLLKTAFEFLLLPTTATADAPIATADAPAATYGIALSKLDFLSDFEGSFDATWTA